MAGACAKLALQNTTSREFPAWLVDFISARFLTGSVLTEYQSTHCNAPILKDDYALRMFFGLRTEISLVPFPSMAADSSSSSTQ
jgi:hypothetical protein